uniref:Uncharacterized protein n=1 Tax=Arundo donax TaxID=35708 RepID=A0A0A9C825_ARUDO
MLLESSSSSQVFCCT